MSNHNQYRKVSSMPQANTIVYSDESGYISEWLNNDPVIASLKQSNEFIGTVAEIPSGEDLQDYLSNYVRQVKGRNPQNGDEVAIEDVSELWQFSGTFGKGGTWVFFTNTTLKDASTTEKGVMQVGSGLNVSNGLVSVDSTIYTPSRIAISNTSTTPSLSIQANSDYTFTNALTSLTITSVADSPYFSTLIFTTSSSFTWSAPNTLEYYFVDKNDIASFFTPNTKYELVITNGRCHINYIGARKYPINKVVATNPSLNAVDNIITWTISNSELATSDVFIRVYETSTGNTVEVDSTVTNSTITLKLYTDSSTVSAGTYTAVILG